MASATPLPLSLTNGLEPNTCPVETSKLNEILAKATVEELCDVLRAVGLNFPNTLLDEPDRAYEELRSVINELCNYVHSICNTVRTMYETSRFDTVHIYGYMAATKHHSDGTCYSIFDRTLATLDIIVRDWLKKCHYRTKISVDSMRDDELSLIRVDVRDNATPPMAGTITW
jgi:hypothetical protein